MCIRDRKEEKLHLLRGLGAILLDIDKAIAIIRGTEKDAMVVPNLMEGFQLDKVQAEYVADIRLRNINKEYILKLSLIHIFSSRCRRRDWAWVGGEDFAIQSLLGRQGLPVISVYG